MLSACHTAPNEQPNQRASRNDPSKEFHSKNGMADQSDNEIHSYCRDKLVEIKKGIETIKSTELVQGVKYL